MAEVLILHAAQIPFSLRFDWFAFADEGANLTSQFLLAQGYRPAIDFGYQYGLLSLLFGRLWLDVFGTTPFAYQAAMLTCNLALAWALARLATSLRLNRAAILLIVAAMPFAARATYHNFAHALELALLSNALAEHASGRRSTALALATAALFVKPSMGYVYGLLLLIVLWLDWRLRSERFAALVWRLVPAALTCVALAVTLATLYGVKSLIRTVFPLVGIANYRALHYGFFRGSGRAFLHPSGVGAAYYLQTVVLFWIVATLWLVAMAVHAGVKLWRGRVAEEAVLAAELAIVCALMHLAFIGLFFGSPLSWFYYFYVLLIGVAATSVLATASTRVQQALFGVALLGLTSTVATTLVLWKSSVQSAAMQGLWSSPKEAVEWETVLERVRGQRPVLLEANGAADLMFGGFAKPLSAYLLPGVATASELQRKLDQISGAAAIVVPKVPPYDHLLQWWPEFAHVLARDEVTFRGKYFLIYRRPASRSLPHEGFWNNSSGVGKRAERRIAW